MKWNLRIWGRPEVAWRLGPSLSYLVVRCLAHCYKCMHCVIILAIHRTGRHTKLALGCILFKITQNFFKFPISSVFTNLQVIPIVTMTCQGSIVKDHTIVDW